MQTEKGSVVQSCRTNQTQSATYHQTQGQRACIPGRKWADPDPPAHEHQMQARLCPRLAPAARRVSGGLKDTQNTCGQYDSIESGRSMHTHLGLARRAHRNIPRVLGATPLGCCGRGARACCQGTGADGTAQQAATPALAGLRQEQIHASSLACSRGVEHTLCPAVVRVAHCSATCTAKLNVKNQVDTGVAYSLVRRSQILWRGTETTP